MDEIQDKPIRGITGRNAAWFIGTILILSSSFWAAYFKNQARFDLIENKREIEMLINKQVIEGVRQNTELNSMQIKVNTDIIKDLEERLRVLESKK